MRVALVLATFALAAGLRAPLSPHRTSRLGYQPAIRMTAASGATTMLIAPRSGGRVGGRVGGGGGGRGGGGAYRGGGGGVTNVYMAPPMFSPFGFGFSPFGFSPFGFGFGIPAPLLLLGLGGLALTSFRSSRGIEAADTAGTALCLQVACYCEDRQTSLAGKLQSIARTADAGSYEGLQAWSGEW